MIKGLQALQYIGISALSWQEHASRRFSSAKTVENLMMLRTLLDEKYENGIFVRLFIETTINTEFGRVHRWLEKMDKILFNNLPNNQKPTVEELEKLVSESSKLKFQPLEVSTARAMIRRAKAWLTAVKRTGIEKGEANRDDLKKLLLEAEEIPLDLSENILVLSVATRVYCFCRRGFSDAMIECMHCKGWFHLKCVNVPRKLVVRRPRYCCPACLIDRTALAYRGVARTSLVRIRLAYKELRKHLTGTTSESDRLSDLLQNQQPHRHSREKLISSLYVWTERCAPFLDDENSKSCVFPENVVGRFDYVNESIVTKEEFAARNALRESNRIALKEKIGELASEFVQFQMIADAQIIMGALKCRLWCDSNPSGCFQHEKAPTLEEVLALRQDIDVNAPDFSHHSFCVFISLIMLREEDWSGRALAILKSDKSVKRVTILEECELLLEQAKFIPITMRLEKSIAACVDDGANRYCLCNGFNDGEFMINCDDCNNWYHGHCVNLTQDIGDSVNSYVCPPCAERKGVEYEYTRKSVD